MAEITPNMCPKVVEKYLERINACNTSQHIEKYDLENMWFQFDFIWLRFHTIKLFCGATRKTVFMQINLQLLNT